MIAVALHRRVGSAAHGVILVISYRTVVLESNVGVGRCWVCGSCVFLARDDWVPFEPEQQMWRERGLVLLVCSGEIGDISGDGSCGGRCPCGGHCRSRPG